MSKSAQDDPSPAIAETHASKGPEPSRTPTITTTPINLKDVDDTTTFYNTHKPLTTPLPPAQESRLIRKNLLYLLGQTWWISFLIHLDRATLSSASTMGIFRDVKMTKNEYNRLFIVFYVGYLVALWPGAWVSQRIGHKRFITGSLFCWAVLVGVHPAVRTGREMMAVRFLLGLVVMLLAFWRISVG